MFANLPVLGRGHDQIIWLDQLPDIHTVNWCHHPSLLTLSWLCLNVVLHSLAAMLIVAIVRDRRQNRKIHRLPQISLRLRLFQVASALFLFQCGAVCLVYFGGHLRIMWWYLCDFFLVAVLLAVWVLFRASVRCFSALANFFWALLDDIIWTDHCLDGIHDVFCVQVDIVWRNEHLRLKDYLLAVRVDAWLMIGDAWWFEGVVTVDRIVVFQWSWL